MKEVIEDLKRSIECTKSYGLTSIKIQQEEQLIDYIEELQQRIDKAIEYINNNSYEETYTDENGITWLRFKLDNVNDLQDILLGDK